MSKTIVNVGSTASLKGIILIVPTHEMGIAMTHDSYDVSNGSG